MTHLDLRESPPAASPMQGMPNHPGQSAGTLTLRWEAIHAAADAVAALAGAAFQLPCPAVQSFPQVLCAFGGWRRDLALQGVEDLAIILEPGLAALLAVHDSGADAGPAATALWQEFLIARDAVLALAPPAPETSTA